MGFVNGDKMEIITTDKTIDATNGIVDLSTEPHKQFGPQGLVQRQEQVGPPGLMKRQEQVGPPGHYDDYQPNTKMMNWMNTVQQKQTDTTDNIESYRHPIFASCYNLATDSLWLSIFDNARKGKFPSRITYRGEKLMYKSGNKIHQVHIPNDPLEAFNIARGFITKHTGLRAKRRNTQSSQNIQFIGWRNIKSSIVRESLIYHFSQQQSRQQILLGHTNKSIKEQRLSFVIKTGLGLGQIHPDDISLDNNVIINIKGLSFDQQTQNWRLDKPYYYDDDDSWSDIYLNPPPPRRRKNYIQLWKSYLSGYQNSQRRSQMTKSELYSNISMKSDRSDQSQIESNCESQTVTRSETDTNHGGQHNRWE